jgi:hypothetical protein
MKPATVVPPLLALALLALLGALAMGGSATDDVITTIDVQYHHLGDHFVPTYQPQESEGLEYENTFELSGEVENPAIQMWVRGLVPAHEVTIDYVKLYINDVLLGYINEYAIGSGSIYDVDDEVEVEVSIEEGILVQGTNRFKIVTGWGHSINDRDDIMFWNIRLVRAKPLEVSCNLVTPSPGDAHHPGLDVEEVTIMVWNDRHVDALQWVRVTVDLGGANVAYRWTQNVDSTQLEPFATKHAGFPLGWWSTSKDLLNRTWTISARMSFLWTFPTEGPIDITVLVRDDQTKMHTFTFEDVLEVRTSLVLSGPASIVGDAQGPLGPGSWVRGGENITVTVPPVIYEGSKDVHPPGGTVTLSMLWGELMASSSVQSPGTEWSANWTVPRLPRDSVTLTIRAEQLPTGARGPEPVMVELEVDGRSPTWLSTWPPNDSWLLDPALAAWADVTDSDGVGTDPFSVEFQQWDPGTGAWGPWMPASFLEGDGEGGVPRALTTLVLDESPNHAIRWRATDKVGNGPSASVPVVFGVDLQPVQVEPEALVGWNRVDRVKVSALVMDPLVADGGSGVDPASVEYSLLLAGNGGWSDWAQPDSVVPGNGSRWYMAHVEVDIEEGGDNYIRWRARDLAGNPITISAPEMLMVDTVPPGLVSYWPTGDTFERSSDVRAIATFTDGTGSGVDMDRVEFAVSTGDNGSFGEWIRVEVTGTADMSRAEVTLDGIEGHDNWVRWRVWDLAGNGPVEYGPYRLRVNLPPIAVISSPADGSNHRADASVQFSAEGSWDPDADDLLSYEWMSDVDGYLGSGHYINVVLSTGEHTVTLVVDDGLDGDHVVSASVDLRLVERTEVKEPISIWLLLLIIIIVVTTLAVARELIVSRRRRLRGLL